MFFVTKMACLGFYGVLTKMACLGLYGVQYSRTHDDWVDFAIGGVAGAIILRVISFLNTTNGFATQGVTLHSIETSPAGNPKASEY